MLTPDGDDKILLSEGAGSNYHRAALLAQAWSPDGTFIVVHHRQNLDEWKAFAGVTYDAVVAAMKRASGR
jgi:Tol biopolymer transport system component